MSSVIESVKSRRRRRVRKERNLAVELAVAEERLEAVTTMVVQLRRSVRQARPLDVPELTDRLHGIEAVAAGKKPYVPPEGDG